MKTDGRRQSDNIEDRRGQAPAGRRFPGGRVGAGGGLGFLAIIILALLLGVDPRQVIDPGSLQGSTPVDDITQTSGPLQESVQERKLAEFVKVILADNEDTWSVVFQSMGREYPLPVLVLFSGSVESACGFAQSAAGPFYCPGDQKVYLDLSFFDEMSNRLGAGGDFAMAYVIAHEVGHHVQTILGVSGRVNRLRARASETEANALSVRLELQADCLAGVWARRTEQQKKVMEVGDLEEALNAAAAVGDDRLQKRAQGYVVPESFTHGSSAERMTWFRRGFNSGDINQCDTFGGGI